MYVRGGGCGQNQKKLIFPARGTEKGPRGKRGTGGQIAHEHAGNGLKGGGEREEPHLGGGWEE